MSVRARPTAQSPTAQSPTAQSSHLPLKRVLAAGFENSKASFGLLRRDQDVKSEDGALCEGQVLFVGKQGLSNHTMTFKFRVKGVPITNPWKDVLAGVLKVPKSLPSDPKMRHFTTPDTLDEVVRLLDTLHKNNPQKFLIIDDSGSEDGLSLYETLDGNINRGALDAFLAKMGPLTGVQNCVIYLSPYRSLEQSVDIWTYEK
jgi:hypothetical protein